MLPLVFKSSAGWREGRAKTGNSNQMLAAQDDLATIKLLSDREMIAMNAIGWRTVADAIGHFPRRYEDRRRFDAFPNQITPQPVCLRGSVVDTSVKHFGSGRSFFEAVVMDTSGGVFGSGKVTCRWFNMPFIGKLVATGLDLCVFGKAKEANGRLIIDHPEFEILRDDDDEASVHLERIVPIYRNVAGISQRRLRGIMYQLLAQVDHASLVSDLDFAAAGGSAKAFSDIHFPETHAAAISAQRQFALEEFFALQLNVVWRRTRHSQQTGRILGRKTAYLKAFYSRLPFDLTDAQKRCIKEILADMRSPRPMNRLLQGDVGSGKTFVAMAAMLLAVESGCQAALMAPTQILAEQHFLTFRRWLEPLDIRIALRTGNREEDSHQESQGEPQIVIGTHALLYDSVAFQDLGFVVIDEQHRFGVVQRASLICQGVVPDVLVMTATPIPRTLTMTVYGDLDISLLDEKPRGRGKIITAVRIKPKQQDINRFVKSQLAEGRQAYLVYPLVDESEVLKAESATEAFAKWKKRLAGYEVGLIHGKLKPEEKEAVMAGYRAGHFAALVATTVIEVGLDVPNASLMLIHNAERFGLAQLHQLRGRVGRGNHKGYCILLTDGKNPDALEKVRVLERCSDGFEIAEEDLRLRGPGNVLGTVQSGISDFRFADYLTDIHLLREARDLAEKVLTEDPELTGIHRKMGKWIQDGQADAALPAGA